MNWGVVITLFFFSTIKFMFTPFSGPAFDLPFIETYVICVSGGVFGAAVFYFSSGYFMRRATEKHAEARKKALENGTPFKEKRKFTRTNKTVVRIKHRLGIIGTALWVPFFLSVPIGSIITAKFFRHDKRTFPLIVLGMGVNGLITTSLAYLIY